MKAGDIVKVTNDFNPKAIVPAMTMRLVYLSENGKWYAYSVYSKEYVAELDYHKIMRIIPPMP